MYLFDSLIICSNISRAFVIEDFKTRLFNVCLLKFQTLDISMKINFSLLFAHYSKISPISSVRVRIFNNEFKIHRNRHIK